MASKITPKKCPIDLDHYPKLSREQAGHLRHFHNLAAQLDGQWDHMGTQEPMQEFLDAYRYQLATMTYAAGAAHYHRLPALRGLFKPLFERLIHKMLRREVWGYWFSTSMSGDRLDPDLMELRKPWADPVVRENIMYSGHLLMMVSLYAMLFDDDQFEHEGSLEFRWDPLFWGMGPQTFSYSTQTLEDAILREMERGGYLGVCCEPNMVFIICNQFPIIGVRYNDVRRGSRTVEELLEKYRAAWNRKGGFVAENGQFYTALMQRQDLLMPSPGPGSTAWASAYMNAWNSDYVKSIYETAALGHITDTESVGVRLHPTRLGHMVRRLITKEGASPTAKATLDQAKQILKSKEKATNTNLPTIMKLIEPSFGYVIQWLSELGKKMELEGLLQYADQRLQPKWENGGLFYPRHDQLMDEEMNLTAMDPFTGNAAIGYARLNVKDGQKKMYEEPWSKDVLKARPWVDGAGLADGVDFSRGVWDDIHSCLVITVRTWDGESRLVDFHIKNLSNGVWELYDNGSLVVRRLVQHEDSITYKVDLDGKDRDLVLLKAIPSKEVGLVETRSNL